MIQLNRIEPQTVDLYNPNNEWLGLINEYELNDLLIQLNEHYKQGNPIKGYYVVFNDIRIDLLESGHILHEPEGFFDLRSKQFERLLGF
jgi:hypothetical protein